MEGPRGAKKSEFPKVIDLINKVFRTDRGHNPTMKEEFPILLVEENIDNIRVIVEDGVPVSDVNFVQRQILIENASIEVASIGAVCTHPDHRGKGYSSLILDDVEKKMYEDGVDMLLVSGTRSLYARRGCTQTKNFMKYTIEPKNIEMDLELREYNSSYLEDIMPMYNSAATRFYRSREDFEKLIESAVMPWGPFTYKRYVIFRENKLIGYVFMRIIEVNEKFGQVIECFGESEDIFKILSNLGKDLKLKNVFYMVNKEDKKNHLKSYSKCEEFFQEGTVKVINFTKLMKNLSPYFKQYLNSAEMKELKFYEENNEYIIEFKNEILKIKDIVILNKLLFEGTSAVNDALSNEFKHVLDMIFPMPFPWVANLNYQ
ncbi:Acetyltransferase (GNAT) domain-containing protein [Clostridium collagenovorans DSM 3089]|uniref:Acetyltransferase (GNAT) domain-containing protein n=1 Tax=Clostridium collagenovorans DSM 3089 TaxID=1121306 RepID=A0A1M5WN76_9CLOT|nr:GNAT family N-acetyltransferase [Clostridium collagenovorans]SHH88473.1 Acetyltransferase (GNAT) domain-containing protein [Clostridium collagenovorans DSM 3089]